MALAPAAGSAFGLFRCGVLEASFCARPCSTEQAVRYARSSGSDPAAEKKKLLANANDLFLAPRSDGS